MSRPSRQESEEDDREARRDLVLVSLAVAVAMLVMAAVAVLFR